MNSATFFNKIGITLFSAITSVLSGINRLVNRDMQATGSGERSIAPEVVDVSPTVFYEPAGSRSMRWELIQQAALSLLLWVILGLAAGFLLGMIKGG